MATKKVLPQIRAPADLYRVFRRRVEDERLKFTVHPLDHACWSKANASGNEDENQDIVVHHIDDACRFFYCLKCARSHYCAPPYETCPRLTEYHSPYTLCAFSGRKIGDAINAEILGQYEKELQAMEQMRNPLARATVLRPHDSMSIHQVLQQANWATTPGRRQQLQGRATTMARNRQSFVKAKKLERFEQKKQKYNNTYHRTAETRQPQKQQEQAKKEETPPDPNAAAWAAWTEANATGLFLDKIKEKQHRSAAKAATAAENHGGAFGRRAVPDLEGSLSSMEGVDEDEDEGEGEEEEEEEAEEGADDADSDDHDGDPTGDNDDGEGGGGGDHPRAWSAAGEDDPDERRRNRADAREERRQRRMIGALEECGTDLFMSEKAREEVRADMAYLENYLAPVLDYIEAHSDAWSAPRAEETVTPASARKRAKMKNAASEPYLHVLYETTPLPWSYWKRANAGNGLQEKLEHQGWIQQTVCVLLEHYVPLATVGGLVKGTLRPLPVFEYVLRIDRVLLFYNWSVPAPQRVDVSKFENVQRAVVVCLCSLFTRDFYKRDEAGTMLPIWLADPFLFACHEGKLFSSLVTASFAAQAANAGTYIKPLPPSILKITPQSIQREANEYRLHLIDLFSVHHLRALIHH